MSDVQPEISDIPIEEDTPKESSPLPVDDIDLYKARSAEAREDKKNEHTLSKDTWVTIAGFILVFLLTVASGIVSWKAPDKPYITSFLNLVSSSIMLILGYLFGSRNNQQ